MYCAGENGSGLAEVDDAGSLLWAQEGEGSCLVPIERYEHGARGHGLSDAGGKAYLAALVAHHYHLAWADPQGSSVPRVQLHVFLAM
jgi:hypothetical protein